jgi:hypothetical protein
MANFEIKITGSGTKNQIEIALLQVIQNLQQGVFTLTCGDIQELSEEDKEEVFSQIPEETLGIDDE